MPWNATAVGQVEVALRHPRLRDLVALCVALETPLSGFVPLNAPVTQVELAGDAALTVGALRALLSGESAPGGVTPAQPFPGWPSPGERHASLVLAVPVDVVRKASRDLWGRTFEAERDARTPDVEGDSTRSRQARRGLVAREMYRELRAAVNPAR